MTVLFDGEQSFTCRSCTECCRRAFDILVTEAEEKKYKEANASRWFRETEAAEPGATLSPFEFMASGAIRIRKRPDGTCGFLSPDNRCRIHEELGARAKPLTCQMFPFTFDPVLGATRVSASTSCPTVLRNEGLPLAAQLKDIDRLVRAWRSEYAPVDRLLEWAPSVSLTPELLDSIKWVFRRLLDLHEPTFSLRRNVRRIAALADDWTRSRVLKLEPDKFEEYVKLTGEFAVTSPADPVATRRGIPHFLFRGFFFASIVPLASRLKGGSTGLSLRLRLLRLMLHVHGIGPSFHGLKFGVGRSRTLDIDVEPFFTPAYHVLRALIENLGSGRRPVVEELTLGVAHLLVAEHLFLARSESQEALPGWIQAILDAHDVEHADPRSRFGRILVALAPPPSSLHLFGSR